jgi:hypothetical protein
MQATPDYLNISSEPDSAAEVTEKCGERRL